MRICYRNVLKHARRRAYCKLISVCVIAISLGGCAVGRMFMAGYTPPQTIADLLNEQYALAGEPNLIGAGGGNSGVDVNKTNNAITSASYKGELVDDNVEPSLFANYQRVKRFNPHFTYKSVQDYAGQLAMDLLKNANGLTASARIGVTSFVKLDHTLQNTTILGNQMAEYAISEIQQFGINVVDFKMMPAIVVSKKGDLAFSRDINQLLIANKMNHVLSATMIEKADGVFINARIIEMNSNRVVSSASVLVPRFVSEQINVQYVQYTP